MDAKDSLYAGGGVCSGRYCPAVAYLGENLHAVHRREGLSVADDGIDHDRPGLFGATVDGRGRVGKL